MQKIFALTTLCPVMQILLLRTVVKNRCRAKPASKKVIMFQRDHEEYSMCNANHCIPRVDDPVL